MMGACAKALFANETWSWVKMDDLVPRSRLRNGKSIKVSGIPPFVDCLRISAMRDDRIDCSDTKQVSMNRDQAKEYLIHRGDVFIVRGNGPAMRDMVWDKARTTAGIWKINQQHIVSLMIPMTPIAEQRRIVAYLDGLQAKVDELRHLHTETQKELDALMPSILAEAFAGEL